MDERPIGIFDSGVGGLTVLNEYLRVLPNENYIYFGDTARLPYGSKSEQTIIEYSKQIADFLISKDVKMIVIACGTASAIAYNTLKNFYNIPILNIITPTAQKLYAKSIGVIATKATIRNGAWEKEITKFSPNSQITSIACPLFVPIIEEGLANSKIADLAIAEYLSKFKNIDALILGCTHYPILKDKIEDTIGKNVEIINPGTYSAEYAKKFLEDTNSLNTSNTSGKIDFYSSDDTAYFKDVACTFFPMHSHEVKRVNF